MSLQDKWRFTVSYVNGTPELETTGVTFETLLAQDDGPLERPRYSRALADEIVRQGFEGIFDLAALKQAAPKHDASLWGIHPPEMPHLGRARFDWMVKENASGSRRAVVELPPECCWTALHFIRRTLILYQRSLDLWKGAPYDWALLRAIAVYAGAKRTLWHVGSAHLYESDLEAINEFLTGA